MDKVLYSEHSHATSELGKKIINRQIENMGIILRDRLEELSKKVD